MGYIYALLSALLFAANGSVIKVLVETGISPAQVTFFRVAGVAAISGIVLLFLDRNAFRLPLRRLGVMVILGITGVAMVQWFYASALSLVPVGIALLLEYMAIILVAVIAWGIFKEQVKARLWWAIVCVIIGLAFVAQIWASTLDPLGVMMGLLAALSLTIYLLLGERLVAQTSALAVAFWSMLFAAAFWAIFSQWWRIPLDAFQTEVSMSGTLSEVILPLWLPMLWNIVLGSFAPFFLSFLALKHLTATAAGIISSSEVIFAFIVAWLWLGEALALNQIIGIAIVLAGILLAQTARVHKLVGPDLEAQDVLLSTGAITVIDVRPSDPVDVPD
ncbi:DMT family transporter [Homoserinimonas sp. OAct 916]|uniref:EamA family transporter n=1 Tax=Homoserinimonas sp. OAct 916 TaxID=2211450 RepID=UPI000DBEAA06|nr:DMT family transporter [Homoserinimonas sp. OAct 916]